jgi:SPP1 gp7 family putative phage head morphogenesis protein
MPENPDLKFALNLPPAEAIKWFESKGFSITWDWEEQVGQAHNRAFTVAKAMTLDILQTVRDGVSKALAEGQSERTFKQNLEPLLKQKGWWGRQTVEGPEGEEVVTLGSPYRLKTIYQTNMQSAMMAGRQKDFLENVGNRPYWQYVAVLDERTRPTHRALDGRVFRYDDPFWQSFTPPLGWNCRCRFRALSERDIQKRDLTVESSDGLLSEQNKLLSIRSGIQVPVTVLKDPLGDIHPDPGFGYSKLDMSWHPDLEKYDAQLAREHVKATLKGQSFADFVEGHSEADYPVGILSPEQKAAQGTDKQTVYLRQQDLDPALSVEDYRKIPELLESEDLSADVGGSLLRLLIGGVARLFGRLLRG